MNKFLFGLLSALLPCMVYGQIQIKIFNAQGPSQSMTPQVMRLIDEANRMQNHYRFVMEFRPGGFESIGINSLSSDPAASLVTVTNTMIESIEKKLVRKSDLVGVFSFGDACWALITNFGTSDRGVASIINSGIREITVGGPAIGGAAHLIALEIGHKYNIPVRYVVYRSNYDALLHMTADDHSVNMVMDRLINYDQMRKRNPKIQALGVNCPERHRDFPTVRTLAEQQITGPYIWQQLLATKDMPISRRQDIEKIFVDATRNLGRENLFGISDFISPVFLGQIPSNHYRHSIDVLDQFRQKHLKAIQLLN